MKGKCVVKNLWWLFCDDENFGINKKNCRKKRFVIQKKWYGKSFMVKLFLWLRKFCIKKLWEEKKKEKKIFLCWKIFCDEKINFMK